MDLASSRFMPRYYRSRTRHLAALDRVEDAISVIGAKTRRIRGKERQRLRSILLNIEQLFYEMACDESQHVIRVFDKAPLAAKNKLASLFDEGSRAQAADISGFRNAAAAIAQLINDTLEEEFEARHGLTSGEASSKFQDELLKQAAAEVVTQGVNTLPLPDKDGLN